jgi:uncharacterized protein YjbI with pentapeptide repeats
MIKKLKIIGSNCINLLAGTYSCDLTNRDFSHCAIPYAYFYNRDLSRSNFSYANMKNSVILDANLN